MATIKEIAQKAGVSIGTVDRVLHDRGMVNEQTKKRVLAVMQELNYQPNQAAQGLAIRKKKLKLSFLIPNPERHPFFTKIYEAAEKKAQELEQYGVQVVFEVLQMSPDLYFQQRIKLKKELLEMDGIVMIGMETPEIELYLDEVEKRNIPVVFYNGVIPHRKYLAYVGCNYVNSGRLAAGLSALSGGEDARVCIYSEGLEGAGICSYDERLRGFRQEAETRYPNMKILDKREISGNQIDNYLSALDMFEKFPDVNIVYVVNPADYGICEAISRADAKHQVRIITNDLVEEQIEMIQQGIISATVCQEPEKQGAMPLEILFQYLAFGTVPEDRNCYTNLSIHIVQNI